MPFDAFEQGTLTGRQARGQQSYVQGICAENTVAKHYKSLGATLLSERWRGAGAELDLVFDMAGTIVFVEVKSSKNHARAVQSLTPSQLARICRAAESYIGDLPKGLLTPMRIDLATVDQYGSVETLENISV